ncbi:MAG: DUF465 domain-containing protein [Chitinophagaceae bacterium]|nr:DUF465 domain-containing protein [Chitinophagaceae bacterium]
MSMEKHDLLHEFPEHKAKIHELRTSDAHFKKQLDEYHQLDDQIYRIEDGSEITSDEYLNELRLKRVHLKDNLYRKLQGK